MTMYFEHSLSGGQVGLKIADNPEEFWCLLETMVQGSSTATETPEDFAQEVAEHAGSTRPISDKVVQLLYLVAAKIEAAHHG